jgi:flavin reductase (NADH)
MAADEFRGAMRLLAGAVTLIGTRFGDERSALTATAVCSLATAPARVLACINISGHTYHILSRSRCMSVNLLAHDQEELAQRFAGRLGARDDDHFARAAWRESVTGAPLLTDALATLDCRVAQMTVLDTHAIVIGTVLEVRLGPWRPPLLYFEGAFTTVLSAFEAAQAGV